MRAKAMKHRLLAVLLSLCMMFSMTNGVIALAAEDAAETAETEDVITDPADEAEDGNSDPSDETEDETSDPADEIEDETSDLLDETEADTFDPSAETEDDTVDPSDEMEGEIAAPAEDASDEPLAILADEPIAVAEGDHDHTSGDWQVLDVTGGTLGTGSYYLEKEVTLSDNLTIDGEVTLCLNGNELNLGEKYQIIVSSGATLTLDDCSGGGKITGLNSNNAKGAIHVSGNLVLESGSISDNHIYYGAVYVESGTFTMNNGIISGNSAVNGAGVYVVSGTFTMNSGKISGNSANTGSGTGYGGGVYLYPGNAVKFTMNGGTISQNTAWISGGGVYVGDETAFEFNSGEISNNTTEGNGYWNGSTNGGGGGVYAGTDAVVSMGSGAKITGNTAYANIATDSYYFGYGGGVSLYQSTLTMASGAVISGNKVLNGSQSGSYGYGGGVYASKNSTLTVKGGAVINGNEASYAGGGIYVGAVSTIVTIESGAKISGNNGGTYGGGIYFSTNEYELEGVTISGNTATYGGGVYLSGSTLSLGSGTSISDNTATVYGGGVYVGSNAVMNMEDGASITENTASRSTGAQGAGVYIGNSATLSMSGGEVTNNSVYGWGGGVYVHAFGTFNVSGAAKVVDNKCTDDVPYEDNVYLGVTAQGVYAYITVTGQLADGAQFGVFRNDAYEEGYKGNPILTQGYGTYNHPDVNASEYFFYDNAASYGDCAVGSWPYRPALDENGEAWVGYYVTFKDTSGNTLEKQFVGYNEKAVERAIGDDSRYWSESKTGPDKFNFNTPIIEHTTLYLACAHPHNSDGYCTEDGCDHGDDCCPKPEPTTPDVPVKDERGGGDKGDKPDGIPDDQEIIVIYQVDPGNPGRGTAGLKEADQNSKSTKVEVFDLRESGLEAGEMAKDIDPKGVATANDGYVFWKWTIDDMDDDEYENEIVRKAGDGNYWLDEDNSEQWNDLADFTGDPTVGHVYVFTAYFHSMRYQVNDYGTILPDDSVFEAIPEIAKKDLEGIRIELSEDTKKALLEWVMGDGNKFNHDEGAKHVGDAYWPDEVDLHIQIKVNVEDVRYTGIATGDYDKKLEMDITPYFQVAAAVRGIEDVENPEAGAQYAILSKGVEGADEEGWIEIPVSYPVEMVIPMPAAFATDGDSVHVEHLKNGEIIRDLYANVTSGTVSFTDYNGFSTFIFTVKADEPSSPKPTDPANTAKPNTAPNTGDNSPLEAWTALMILSAMGVLGAGFISGRRKKQR